MSVALTIHEDIETLRSWISTCPKGGMVFFGGAGVSTESGIPDFRSSDGLFMQNYQIPPEQLAKELLLLLQEAIYVRRICCSKKTSPYQRN